MCKSGIIQHYSQCICVDHCKHSLKQGSLTVHGARAQVARNGQVGRPRASFGSSINMISVPTQLNVNWANALFRKCVSSW